LRAIIGSPPLDAVELDTIERHGFNALIK